MNSIKTPIYQSQQIRELERLAEERFSINSGTLMQRAGKAACDFMLKRWPQAQKIAVFCGSGNNGGDGYVLALFARERGLTVTIWQIGNQEHLKEEAKKARQDCIRANLPLLQFDEKADLHHPDVIVDAICGMGVYEDLRADIAIAVQKIQRARAPIFAIDVPTGVDADTGHLLGSAIRANATLTFIGYKLGLLTGNGIACTGDLALNDLQLPSDLFSYVEPTAEKIHLSTYASYLKARARDWHKGLSGHVLIIGGELGYSGAPRMAAEAALRTGAGLVSVATRKEHAYVMNVGCPEIMCHGVESEAQIAPLLERADVIVIGPGLGQTEWSQIMWQIAMECKQPLLVDADALNILSRNPKNSANWVLTPHPGEAARLLDENVNGVQINRLNAAKAIANRYGGVCVLKGGGSIILAPNSLPAICDKGNPGMASAGMGDVLSGVIGGLLSQGIPLVEAAKMGVCLHALAGDFAAKDGERGMIATDLMPYLRRLVNQAG